MITQIFKKTALPALTRHLDLSRLRHKVIAKNIANVNTPGYLSKEVEFNDILNQASNRLIIRKTNPSHLSSISNPITNVVDTTDKEVKNGINNVDIDHEMVELARNQMEFEFSSTILSNLFKTIKSTINEKF